ncbi:hypothetical protein TMatcc_000428 [Talaromyces marneffei ATCC 18224]|nr:hypothetical protein EYB25_007949 [Talaromyces marneffei]
MTFPPPSPAELAAWRERDVEYDAKIAAAKAELERIKAESLLTLDTESVEEAQIEYEWASYQRPKQEYNLQTQSTFFRLLPSEIRAQIYRMVFGNLIIEIFAGSGGFNGPEPSSDYRVFQGSRIVDANGGGKWASHLFADFPITYTPHIVPLLQSCRRIYAESVDILYSENVFKSHGHHNDIDWTKFLLHQRLQTIRSAHFQLNLGYPWTAPFIGTALEVYAQLRALQKLCIVGIGEGMIDSKHADVIDAELWKERKHILIPLFRNYSFIKDVDIFLPIMQKTLVQQDKDAVCGPRLHGWTEEQRRGEKPAFCACVHQPEKLSFGRTSYKKICKGSFLILLRDEA